MTISSFLISGVRTAITGILPVNGMQNFSVFMEGAVSGAANANGTMTLDGRVHPSSSFSNIKTVNFTNSSGVLVQFNGPFTDLRGSVTTITSGTFNLAYSANT